jgi:hypothetical protein
MNLNVGSIPLRLNALTVGSTPLVAGKVSFAASCAAIS